MRIESTAQSIKVVGMMAGKVTAVKTYSLEDLTLTPETPTTTIDAADVNNDDVYTAEELAVLTKAQLLELAGTLGVTGVSSSNTKAQIIAAIVAAQEG